LIEKGADIEAKDDDGWTPLHHASHHGHTDTEKMSIENGANLFVKDEEEKVLWNGPRKKTKIAW